MKKTAPIAFAGCELAESRHVCAFFNSDEEAGEDLAHRRRLAAAGIDLNGAEQVGQRERRPPPLS